MSFLSRLFSSPTPNSKQPAVVFGRYTDAYKSEAQQSAWNRSLQLFEEKRPIDAYREMLIFLRDEQENNVRWTEDERGLIFEFHQGSRKITGHANRDQIKVESRIAWVDELKVSFMRRLVEQNFKLRYARFALSPDNCLTIVFDSSTRDGSPYKLVQAFIELSVNADKQDDLLLEEFKTLRPVEEAMEIIPLPENEKITKVKYIRQEINTLLQCLEAAHPDPNRYPGGYVYLMLGTAFRIDYLTRPEGFVMDSLEKIFKAYFNKDEKVPAIKVEVMRKLFQKIIERSDASLMAELYNTKSTFGINPTVGHDRIQSLLDSELPKMDWHLDQNHSEILQMAIVKYAAGYALYHCAPPPPDRDYLHLFYHITEQPFFTELGFEASFYSPDGKLKKTAIEQGIKAVTERWNKRYKRLKPDLSLLDYTTLPLFARSYLRMVRGLDLG
jgi:hypothetical protein